MFNTHFLREIDREIDRLAAQKTALENARAILGGSGGIRSMNSGPKRRGRPPGAKNKPGYKKPGPKPKH